MRHFIILAVIFCFTKGMGQTVNSDSVKNEGYKLAVEKVSEEGRTADDKLTFAGFIAGLVSFGGNNGPTLTFQPTIYGLEKLFSKSVSIDTNFAKKPFERNFQFNLGITPNAKNYLSTPADGQLGFTYAIINNKAITLEDYENLVSYPSFEIHKQIVEYLTITAYDSVQYRQIIQSCINSGFYDALPKFLKDSLSKKFGNSYVENGIKVPSKLVDSLAKSLSKRPLLTFDFNSIYAFPKDGWSSLSTKIHSTIYFLKQLDADPSWSTDISFSKAKDSTEKINNLDRIILNINSGLVFGTYALGPVSFEIKLSVQDNRIISHSYAGENKDSFKISISPVPSISFSEFNLYKSTW